MVTSDRPTTGHEGRVNTRRILDYLLRAYEANPEAEVSGAELQHELALDAETVQMCAAELNRQGLVEWDPLLSNVWLRITDKGLTAAHE